MCSSNSRMWTYIILNFKITYLTILMNTFRGRSAACTFLPRPWHDVTRSAAMPQLAHARNMIRNTDPSLWVGIVINWLRGISFKKDMLLESNVRDEVVKLHTACRDCIIMCGIKLVWVLEQWEDIIQQFLLGPAAHLYAIRFGGGGCPRD